MKRKILVLVVLIIVLSGLFILLFTPHEFRKTISLPLPINTVTDQFSKPGNLNKWFKPFDKPNLLTHDSINKGLKEVLSGDFRLEIFNKSIYSSVLKFSKKGKSKEFLFSALPDTTKDGATLLTLSYRNSWFGEWVQKGELEKYTISNFENFNDYTNDTERMYGYEIKPVKVTDTAFLFARRTVPLSEKRIGTKKIFDDLISYAEKRNAGYDGVRIFYSVKTGDKITLFASIGVANRIDIPEKEEFEYKMMPFEKNLLEATYQGPYGEVYKVYDAMKVYKEDHFLTSMAIPFEKFISDGYDFADDQIVQMKVYYPVF